MNVDPLVKTDRLKKHYPVRWSFFGRAIVHVKAVDGISLTIVDPAPDGFTVAVIPHTTEITTLGRKGPGDRVNIEVDVMAKYAEKLLAGHQAAADQTAGASQ